MKKRLVVHIGTHKTGTTSIQDALECARVPLKERGILYPRTDREPWPHLSKHCSVFSAARSDSAEVRQRERDLLLEELAASHCSTMIISEEALSEPDDLLVDFFRPFAAEFDIDVICYLRRQDFFVESMYNQFVREKARRERRSILGFSRSGPTRDRLTYDRILRKWREIARAVIAKDFDKEVKTQGLLKSFVSAVQLGEFELVDSPANRSPSMDLVVLLARLNRYNVDYDLPRMLAANRNVERSGRFQYRKYLLGAEERARLLSQMEDSNSRLSSEFGVSFSKEMPAGEQAFPIEDPDIDYCGAMLAAMSQMNR